MDQNLINPTGSVSTCERGSSHEQQTTSVNNKKVFFSRLKYSVNDIIGYCKEKERKCTSVVEKSKDIIPKITKNLG